MSTELHDPNSVMPVAKMAYEMNRKLVELAVPYVMPEAVPDRWERAPAWQRETVIAGVQAIIDGEVRDAGDSHRAWAEHKLAGGWVYGRVKDPEAKTHPCLVPFEKLPAYQRLKDHLFVQTVTHMLAELGVPTAAETADET